MRSIVAVSAFLLIGILFSTCKKIVMRDITCRSFAIVDENYWFPKDLGDSVTFVNDTGATKTYHVADKYISHTTHYTSDTGCGCGDASSMLLISANDSMWFRSDLKYIEDQAGNRYEDVVFVNNGVQSLFFETYRTSVATYSLDTLTFNDARVYQHDYTEANKVHRVTSARNLGIVQFEMTNGMKWTNSNLNSFSTNTIDSFAYSEGICQ
jgi:hypothetical protein